VTANPVTQRNCHPSYDIYPRTAASAIGSKSTSDCLSQSRHQLSYELRQRPATQSRGNDATNDSTRTAASAIGSKSTSDCLSQHSRHQLSYELRQRPAAQP
jgi:hypothetical protein